MANTSCSFPSINDLLAQAEAGQANITTVVSTCAGICSMAWGAGNPDLSGVGLIICYVFQAVLTVLFGPLFCVLYGCFRHAFTEDTKRNLGNLHDTFLDAIAQFSVPVAAATVIRLHQNPPFYEEAFIHSLTTMQFLSLLATVVTAGIFGGSDRPKSPMRIIVIFLYGLFNFAFYMGVIGELRTSAAWWEGLNELGDACQAHGTLLPKLEAIKKLRWLLPHGHWSLNKNDFSGSENLAKFKMALAISGFILAGNICLLMVIPVIWLLWRTFAGHSIPMIGVISLGLSIGMLYELVRMEQTRTFIQDITGSDFADNQWGLGQIVSLFLWVPICVQAIYWLLVSINLIQLLDDGMAILSRWMGRLNHRLDTMAGTLPRTAETAVEEADEEKTDDKKTDVEG
ncbi:hypothetical protein FIBSPDRAFT_1044847 [Athelia psychrophila]|uniref:Uncharacterized protein n=1 Tax=Athelia psychrophila TaxID=1759441 RepID=A0A166J8C2_9AGAM|nr:hypothetical protein FIBSPDRAFT_1044847 [Fibularhizoctonia sp. CBS 109695]